MKLKEKIIVMTDDRGEEVELPKENKIGVAINGEKGQTFEGNFVPYELKDVFVRISRISGNEIIGFSLLHYFKIEDGKLVDREGHTVEFFLPENNTILKVAEFDAKFIPLDPIHIQLGYVEAFSNDLIGIKEPEAIFSDLENAEKKILVENRMDKNSREQADADAKAKADADKAQADADAKAKEDADKAQADADAKAKEDADKAKADADAKAKADKAKSDADAKAKADKAKADADAKAKADADKAKADADAKQKQEDELKASLNPKFVHDKKVYRETQEWYEDLEGVEYKKDDYSFFYVKPSEEAPTPKEPTLFIKRGLDWWEEIEEGEMTEQNEKNVVYEYLDGKKEQVLTLDIEKGEITIEDVKK